MEAFVIKIAQEEKVFEFIIVDKQSEKCEFEVYLDTILMAVFEPDEHEYIHICRNPGGLDEEIIVQIADKIEAHYLRSSIQ
jgi:hypothetical protein